MMSRRSLLSCLGASVAATVQPLSAASQKSGVIALESFHVAEADHLPRVHQYLRDVLLPLLDGVHGRQGMWLEAVIAPHAPQALLITGYSSFEEMLAIGGKVAAHPRVRQARAELESANALAEVRSQVLLAGRHSLGAARDLATGVVEVRTYRAPGWKGRPPERAGEALGRAGIHPIIDGSASAGEHMPRFTYVIPFASLAAREEAWARLEADPEWHAEAVQATNKSIYKPAFGSRTA
jgi:hypothetical protein